MKYLITLLTLALLLNFSSFSQQVSTFAGPNIFINDAIVFDDNGLLYGARYNSAYNGSNVYRVTPSGEVSIFADGFSCTNGLQFGEDGYLYAVDVKANRQNQIYKIDSEGNKTTYGPIIRGAGGIFFDPLSDTLYVTKYSEDSVVKLAPDGTVVNFYSGPEMNGPFSIAFDEENNIYLANYTDGKVFKFIAGTNMAIPFCEVPFNSFGGVGFLLYHDNYIYATGIGKNKIYRINMEGVLFEFAGTGIPGRVDGQVDTARFSNPNGITINDGGDSIFISDYGTRSIRVISDLATGWIQVDYPTNKKIELEVMPNPVIELAKICFLIPETGMTEINLYSNNGTLIKNLLRKEMPAGNNQLFYNFSDLKSGIYYCKLVSSNMSKSFKIVVI